MLITLPQFITATYLSSEGNDATLRDDIQSCPVNTNGSVGACLQKTAAYATARANHTSVVFNGFIYIIGGWDGGTNYYNDIQYMRVGPPEGRKGTTTTQNSLFTTARAQHSSVVYNNFMYIVGGYGGGAQNDIQYCAINTNGSVNTCTRQTNAFTTARQDHTSVVYNGYLYIIGGFNGFSYQNDIIRCPLNANGSAGACIQQTNKFVTPRDNHTSVVYNGYIYIIGGGNGVAAQSDIVYCPINMTDGSVGTCTQQAGAFSPGRYQHSSVVHNGYLYIIGGSDTITNYSTIQYCPINSNGSVGACISQANAFIFGRSGLTTNVHNGYLYIVGGNSNTTEIQYCKINANGSVSPCDNMTAAFTGFRYGHTSVVSNGYLYIAGGDNGTSALGDVQYMPLLASANKSTYERYFNTGTTNDNIKFITLNGVANCSHTVQYKSAGASGVFGASTTVGAVYPGLPVTLNLVNCSVSLCVGNP